MDLTIDEWQAVGIAAMVILLGVIVGLLIYGMTHERSKGSTEPRGFLQRLSREPAAIGALISACVALGAAFGLDWSAERTAAVTTFVTFIVGWIVRMSVTPVSDPDFETLAEKHPGKVQS